MIAIIWAMCYELLHGRKRNQVMSWYKTNRHDRGMVKSIAPRSDRYYLFHLGPLVRGERNTSICLLSYIETIKPARIFYITIVWFNQHTVGANMRKFNSQNFSEILYDSPYFSSMLPGVWPRWQLCGLQSS